jgi:MFS family permease
MACVGPLFQAIGCWWVPESPRWLVWHGHEEEAWKTVRRLHHDSSDPDEAVAHAEYTQIVQQVEFDKKFEVSYLEMFRKPSWRKRTLLVIFLLFASQSTGVLGIGNYKVLIFTSLGIKGGLPIMTNAIYTMIGTSMSMVGAWLMDRYGRRIMLRKSDPCMVYVLPLTWLYSNWIPHQRSFPSRRGLAPTSIHGY